ncbi:MAG TPA: DegT/DnrJ/EryC1/StrS aminotransferase [Spirochaetia bacterium]|nr:DegT/DnrJ/EryC1/StrS aminotransferase [Spirochaetia bacterium]
MKNAFIEEFETKKALSEFIMKAPRLSMDSQCLAFEKKFAAYQKRKHAVLFNSGGSANLALLQSMKNLGHLHDGDITGFSALTWSTNVMPIIQMSLQPAAIDCSPETINITAELLKKFIAKHKIKCLFITNALGFTGDLPAIRDICSAEKILLLEDNCESLGTELPEGKAGNFSAASTFSFFVAHHMSTIEGGMVCTDDDEIAEMLKIVRANGWDRNLSSDQQHKWRKKFAINSEFQGKYTFYDLGFNFRPTEITGFLGIYQMQFLEKNIEKREKNYLYLESFVKNNQDLQMINHAHISRLSNFSFPVICKTPELRQKYILQFSGAGVEIRPMIAGNMQKQPFYEKYPYIKNELPGTEKIDSCGFYFGNYPELTETDLEVLSSCLKKY